MTTTAFISHSTKDDAIVKAIRENLELQGIKVWVDSRELSAGDRLEATITEAIDQSTHLIAILSQHAVNSPWVKKEIDYVLKRQQNNRNIKIIPLLIDPIKTDALGMWFSNEPMAIKLDVAPGGIEQALPDLLTALGLQLPSDREVPQEKPDKPIADLILELSEPTIEEIDGKSRASAKAELIYHPADGSPEVKSTRFRFTAPLGAIEADDLRWYLERWATWPSNHFKTRADKVEADLPEWGKQLYASLDQTAGRTALEAWKGAAKNSGLSRRFTVLVDHELMEGSDKEEQAKANESATQLLALPWELLHNGSSYLFQGAHGVRVRRQLPNRDSKAPLVTKPPIRILMISPRPEDETAGYIDHRVSARPVVEALAPLGELVQLDILTPSTFKAMTDMLQQAHDRDESYHVVHFDGHGVYDRQRGLGALCFEDLRDADKLKERRTDIVDADRIAAALTDHRVPLFFLEACQSAKAEQDPTASVAGRLLQRGIASVAAMSHSVLVETAHRFVGAFYRALMAGEPVGLAMLSGQRELHGDSFRFKGFSGDLFLQDWFVPVLFQESADPQLIHAVPAEQVQVEIAKQHQLTLGDLPEPPTHHFVGRSRVLLMGERLLEQHRYITLRGGGGEGKTTLAVELARWLVASRRFKRVVFASAEKCDDARKLLWAIGGQLVADFEVEASKDETQALKLIQRQLGGQPTLIVLDNMETILEPDPNSNNHALFEPEKLAKIFELCKQLSEVSTTRLIFTSREPLPAPFDQHFIFISRLERSEAIELVGKVLGEGGLMPHAKDSGESDAEIEKLVEAVQCHARSLVLLAREIARSGVRNATINLHTLMAKLHERCPNDRECSLIASVELSLQRLPQAMRERIGPLGLFHGGGNLIAIARVLELDIEKNEHQKLAQQLLQVGLAEMLPYGHLRLDPALVLVLQMACQLDESQQQVALQRWCDVMSQFTHDLYRQRFDNIQLAATLTPLELPNFLANLEVLHQRQADAEQLVDIATDIEGLLQNLNQPRALARVVQIRTEASQRLEGWSHACFNAKEAGVDRLLQDGRLPDALIAAQALLEEAQAAGEDSYEAAPYDLAMAYFKLGRVLRMAGDMGIALPAIETAHCTFQRLVDEGIGCADRMVSVALSEKGDCLMALGRLDKAAVAYEDAIQRAEKLEDCRQVAVGKFQLGTVEMQRKNYPEALAAYKVARSISSDLKELDMLATSWHQTGMVYQRMKQFDTAEEAYRKSMKIRVQRNDRTGEASSLGQLSQLYEDTGRLEDAVTLAQQAADIYEVLPDLAKEGGVRTNIAHTLIKLNRYDDARTELLRAIECNASYGHTVQPWKAFDILTNLERAVGNAEAAAQARQQAMDAFHSYRRDGGENHNLTGQLIVLITQELQSGETNAKIIAAQHLAKLQQAPGMARHIKAFLLALQQILAGSRDPALANASDLNYDGAVELKLLLEGLQHGNARLA